MVNAHPRAQISLDSKIPSVTPPSTSGTLTYTHWTTVLTNDSTGSDESQLQGKWGWASHHHSESILPSPRLWQDHLWSMPTRGHKSHRIPSITLPPATQDSGLHAPDYFGQARFKTDDAQTDRHGHEWHHQDKGQVRTYSVYGIVTTDYWTISSSWTNFGLHQFRNQQAGLGTGPGPAGIKKLY